MKKCLTILLAYFTTISFGQQWDWTIISNNIGSNPWDGATSVEITTDKDGNIYIGGTISEDSIEIGDTILASNISICNIFVIKFSPSGQILWIKQTGGGDNANWVKGISVDENGNCYITGWINSTCYFDTIFVDANGINVAAFIAKINSVGVFEWVKVVGRPFFPDYSLGADIVITKKNEICVTGYFKGTINIQGTTLASYGDADIFIAKFDIDGSLKWLKQAGSIFYDSPTSIVIDSAGCCYITGQVYNNARFGQIILPTNSASGDGFITKLDTSGNFLWAKVFGSNQTDIGNSVSYSQYGCIYLTGYINGTALFDNLTVQHNGGRDMFVAKYYLDGNISFAKGFGGGSNESARSISVNHLGNLLIAGDFDGTGIIDTAHLYSLGSTDLFAAEFNYNGNLDWIIQYGTSLKDYGWGISQDRFDNVFVTGEINGSGPHSDNTSIFLGKIKNPITPVELAIFTASHSNNNISLNWSTSTELNNRGFEIERSTNKTDWRLIGFKEGNGTTTEIHSYSFVDDLFGESSTKLYYRLKQIDFDGSFEYSDIVEVNITPTEFSLSQNYPNPFNPTTNIEFRIAQLLRANVKRYLKSTMFLAEK